MKTVPSPARASALTQRFCRQRAAAFLLVLPLVLTLSGIDSALAQSQPATKSTASPPATAAEKRGADENPSVTGSIKGRVVADDGQPVVNATLMAQSVNGPPSIK